MSVDQPVCVLSVWTQTSAPHPVYTRGRAVRQSGDLALVQVPPDTVLSLVEIMVLLRQLFSAIKNQLKAPKAIRGISCLSLVLFGVRLGGFHALKGSIKGAGIRFIMIPPIIDSFCACPPITVS